MSGLRLVALFVVLAIGVGQHPTVASPQDGDNEEGQLTECTGSADTGTYLLVPEEGCFYVDLSYNRRHVYVASPDDVFAPSDECGITEDADIIVPSGQDCMFKDNEGSYTMFMNIVIGSEDTANEEEAGSEDPQVEYGDYVLLWDDI